jgi:hypothetical protein
MSTNSGRPTRTPSITRTNIRTYDKAGELPMSAGSSVTPAKGSSTFGASKNHGHDGDSTVGGAMDGSAMDDSTAVVR